MLEPKNKGYNVPPELASRLQSPKDYVPQEELFDQGKKISLPRGGLPSKDGFYTSSKIVREWCLVIQPTVESINLLSTVGVFWDVFCSISSGYISTSGVRLLRPLAIESGFRVPISGIVLPIHGSFVTLDLTRQVPGVNPQVDVDLIVYGLAGWGHPWTFPELAVLAGAGPFLANVTRRTFSTEYQISGNIDVGDTVTQLSPNGTVLLGPVTVTSDFANSWQPIDPDCSIIRYSSPVSKRLLFNFAYRT